MQAEYVKEWMDTYLWVLSDKNSPESYEEKMIACNPKEGWLMFSRQIKDGEEYFCDDDCLHAWYSEEEYDELCQEDRGYWTVW